MIMLGKRFIPFAKTEFGLQPTPFLMKMDGSTLPLCGAILAAGGTGSRMAAARPKQLLLLAGEPILVRSCRALLQVSSLAEIVVVAPAAYLEECQSVCRVFLCPQQMARLSFTPGGKTRQDSVRAGLARLSPDISLILVHDAARPLVTLDLVERCLDSAQHHGAAIAALAVTDTLKEVDAATDEIRTTLDRSHLWQAQTPQVVRRDLLEQAFNKALQDDFQGTDEASLLEHVGMTVRVVTGSQKNLKITRPEDLVLAEALLEQDHRDENKQTRHRAMKIGHGFDVHRLVSGRKLILGGVEIDYHLGLAGHSDADVVSHALIDALLGALGLGDIGRHFPDSDPQYKGVNSLLLLEKVWELAKTRGLALANADITIVCQAPKLMPYLAGMQEKLARSCQAGPEQVNIKATTTEQMGYTGRGEGIAAHAVILLEVTHAG